MAVSIDIGRWSTTLESRQRVIVESATDRGPDPSTKHSSAIRTGECSRHEDCPEIRKPEGGSGDAVPISWWVTGKTLQIG